MSTAYVDAGVRLREELEGANLGDLRRNRRLRQMAERMEGRPGAGFPEMMGDSAELEGCYRLLNNEEVTMERILEPHIEQTHQRAEECGKVLAIHDETTFRFDHADQQEAVGQLRSGGPGFYGRFSLLVDADRLSRPVGVADASIYLRDESGEAIEGELEGVQWGEGGNRWWMEHIERTERRAADGVEMIHLMDAGFESYRRFAELDQNDSAFIARLSTNRKMRKEGSEQWGRMREIAETLEAQTSRTVEVSGRDAEPMPPEQLEKHPPRDRRETELHLASTRVELRRPRKESAELPETQTFEFVYVWEEQPPEGVEPIEWMLLTNVEVETAEDLENVVDWYQGRWRIEQFNKALKTGCGYRQRQLENRRSLLNALAMSLPMAWLLLTVRAVARREEQMPAHWIIDDVQLEVLRECAEPSIDSENPTAQEVIHTIAEMGGHWPSNGPPGWQVLQRGLRQLITLTKGWRAAQEKM